ncbi:hypothetical protein N0V93_009726 [Gnomoniopsis smithogilvyi]|uniref:Nudix hydrolase domain-containing protein n=1 Tax=Gnomoniopsis smithogilvyi TaxID=1191159 RepID=A0A9W8YLD6_9PEZI|nr:hypothetical protein N0V93_009726 [Gnomoniopsis smithogilvyi]
MSGSEDSKSFVLEEFNNVSVTTKYLPRDRVKDLTKDELKEWSPFKTWITTLTASLALQTHASHPDHKDPYKLHDITIDSYTRFANKRIGFLKLTANISKANTPNVTLPGTIFLRGPSVAMLIVLIPDDSDQPDDAHVLLTVQPRIATGSLAFVELPAGMMDADSNFAGKAAQEIEEELGMVIKEEELTCLTDKVAEIRQAKRMTGAVPDATAGSGGSSGDGERRETLPFAMYPSAGGCDEYIKIFAHEKRVSREQLREWQGKLTGLREEGEMITLKVVPLEDLWLEGGMDSKALAALTMYTQLKQWEKKQGG